RHAHLWGPREIYEKTSQEQQLIGGKYHWLWCNDIASTKWTTLAPQSPFYLFIPLNTDLLTEYQKSPKVTDIFSTYSSCLNTLHDDFVISFDKNALKNMLHDAADKNISNEDFRQKYRVAE